MTNQVSEFGTVSEFPSIFSGDILKKTHGLTDWFHYYHFRSTLKRDDFFAYVYVLNVTVLSGYVPL